MPRKPRFDAPEALHQIIVRGIDRRKIFRDYTDRDYFLKRLNGILANSQTRCFAWSLMSNHFHLLLRAGLVPISTIMRRLLTGYAVSFNLKQFGKQAGPSRKRYQEFVLKGIEQGKRETVHNLSQ